MVSFTTKKISRSLTLGERLKRARLRKKLSKTELEDLTKIKSAYIESLEQDNYSKLPSEVYIKGFLQTLASYLSLDSAEVLHQYYRQQGEKEEKKKKPKFFKGVKLPRFILTPKTLIVAIFVIFVLSLGGYLWYQVSGFASTPKLNMSDPSGTDVVTSDESIKLAGSTDAGTSVFINNQSISVSLDGKFEEKVQLKSGLNSIEVLSRNKVGRERTKIISVLCNASENNIAGGEVLGQTSGLSLTIEVAPDPCWISVDVDGENLYKGVMLAKTKRNFGGKKQIVITSANAGSVHLYLNGQDLGTMGEAGERKTVTLTPDNLKAVN